MELDVLVSGLDALFALATAPPDVAMSRHLPRVYDEAGEQWRRWATPAFQEAFNGLMIRGAGTLCRVYGACFPSAEVLDQWLA